MLYGRSTELAEIDRLLADARAGRGGALVLRGEAGIGKSTLLQHAAEAAGGEPGMRVLRAVGVEAEADLAFAGLHQLLWPVQQSIDALPDLQADALRAALGSGSGAARDDRFTTGLAVLTLLADLAEQSPVLCLVDDVQWLDRSTAEALLFAVRRLVAEPVAMLFAAREEAFPGTGLPELHLARLEHADAARLLDERGLPPALHQRIIRESAGNPLALIEFGAARRPPGGLTPLPVADRVLASFRDQIARLPEPTRLMLLIAAAEGRGYLPALLGAAQRLGTGLADLEEAERAGLVRVTGEEIAFRHPLIRSAAYQGAPAARRVEVHRVLAEVAAGDPDCRARHRAAASLGPDEDVAVDLQEAAERARARTGFGTAAELFRQAARLTPDPVRRARRLGDAADAVLRAGHAEDALTLVEEAERRTGDPAVLARLAGVRAAVEFERGDAGAAARLLVEHAAHASPEEAESMLCTGASYAWTSGDAATLRAADVGLDALGRRDKVVHGMALVIAGDYAGGLPLLAEAVAEARSVPDARHRAVQAGLILGDDAATLELTAADTAGCRRNSLVASLPDVLRAQLQAQIAAGLHREAEATAAEARTLARDLGMRRSAGEFDLALARLAAIEGDEARLRELLAGLPSDGGAADCALALLDLGAGRHLDALHRLEELARGPLRHASGVLPAADQVEAAVRAGLPERAAEPLERLESWAKAADLPWTRAVALRSRGLVDDAEAPYAEAVAVHRESGGRPFERARTELLHGEWLRRARRRSDARDPLRSALEIFESLRAAPWAERARTELRATGDTAPAARPAAPDLLDRLTPQELQVVRLAAEGSSSREIAAQLFLSPRTVEYHLYKAYPKLGISSRRELPKLALASG